MQVRSGLLSIVLAVSLGNVAVADDGYRVPPKEAVDILDIAPPPAASVSPDGHWMVVTSLKAMPTIADRSAPMAALGGVRVNVKTNGPYDTPRYDDHSSYTGTGTSYRLIDLGRGGKKELAVPTEKLGPPFWSPDSSRFAFLHTTASGIELWVVDVSSGTARALTGPVINAARSIDRESDAPCSWMSSAQLLCHLVPANRGEAPVLGVPAGPAIQETHGEAAPVWTFTNLLADKHDEQLYDYYMTSQPTLIDASSGATKAFGTPAIYQQLTPSGDGKYLLSVRIVPPYSYLVPASRFPKDVTILGKSGEIIKNVATLPVNNAGPESMGWAPAGARGFAWVPGSSSLLFVAPLDGGDPKKEAEFRDSVKILEAPFKAEPRELMRTANRVVNSNGDYAGGHPFVFTADGRATLVKEFAWATRGSKMWLAKSGKGTRPALLWEHNDDDWYGDPGVPVLKMNAQGAAVLRQHGDWMYLSGEGGSADGDHPFLARYNLSTRKTERLLATQGQNYEAVVDVLDDGAARVVTRYETSTDYPNYYLHELAGDKRTALTDFTQVPSTLTRAVKQQINYVRNDGVPLSGTLYLPPGYQKGQRLPTLIWAYPREFADVKGAGQVRGSSYQYSGLSMSTATDYMLFLTQGYAVLANAAMPIVGGLQANDTYVTQLVANAQAAVDKLVEMGVSDRDRMGVAGLSYGAFMTMNLLVHSDIFASGIAMNGAYNRTLTPFGFQRERRTFWEAPEVYLAMSPFIHATQLKEPVLMFHGEADSNTGTYPIQTLRMYHALKGLGATARLVMYPHEDHIYAARESRLHVLAESFDWFDKYVKHARKE
ncbi:S9 family peptidase [Peristeroidobacter soli]|uniref:S9 family peptidase n=1 Tax=Peristeroidobacter soli TaxID=2497877 RepID=UPI001300296C|nr:prolyl oligopeptidase family serine peptidase [Peristeroidobacter soli]